MAAFLACVGGASGQEGAGEAPTQPPKINDQPPNEPAFRRITLKNGGSIEGDIVRHEAEHILLRTAGRFGPGLLTVPTSEIAGNVEAVTSPSFQDQLARAEILLKDGDLAGAVALLDTLIRSFPSERGAAVAYARALRGLGKHEAASFLLEKVYEGDSKRAAPASLDVLREAAETALLGGDARAAKKALKRLADAARKDDAMRLYANALQQQADGGPVVVTTSGLSPAADRSLLVRERKSFNADEGDSALSAQLAREIKNFCDAWGGVEGARVLAEVHPASRDFYAAGGAEDEYVKLAGRVEIHVRMSAAGWNELFDWQHKVLLWGAAFRARRTYPRSPLSVVFAVGDDREPKRLGSATWTQREGLRIQVHTSERRDVARDARLKDAYRERQLRRR